jgi:aryl-alcohol dehydrogenase-like predicted oxidoreductase
LGIRSAQLGTTGLRISRVGLGAWALGGGEWQGGWGPQDDAESIAAVHRAVERGVNWVDTAPAYGLGRAELVVGEALRRLPEADRPLVFTKCGLLWNEGEKAVFNSLSSQAIRKECEDSLRRLGVERLDLFQAHWPTWDATPLEESWSTMAALADEGKVRFIGLSNFTADDLKACEQIRHVDTFQPQLNLLVREAVSDTLPLCAENGTGVLVYSPMRSGLLTGHFSAERVAGLPTDDWRATCDDFLEPKLSQNLALVDRLKPVAERRGVTLAELSIAWALSWSSVTAAIVGARRPEQVDGWVHAGDLELEDKDLDDIAAAVAETGAGSGPVPSSERRV